MKTTGKKIQEIRKSKGLSQEELADRANLSLRTVQRIENGENEPRGHTLSEICKVLDVRIEDIVDYGKVENKSFFIYLHLSVIAGLLFPFGDIVAPLLLWLSNKNKIIGLDTQAKNLVTFRIIFDIVYYCSFIGSLVYILNKSATEDFKTIFPKVFSTLLIVMITIHILVNIIYPIYIAVSINKSDRIKNYYPRFFK